MSYFIFQQIFDMLSIQDSKLIQIQRYHYHGYKYSWHLVIVSSAEKQLDAMVQKTLEKISNLLTEEVILRAFRRRTNSADTIRCVEVKRAAPAGEGLVGAVFRIKVTGNNHTASFIVKSMVQDALLRKSLDCWKYYWREITFFSTVLPALIEFQARSGAKEKIQNNIPLCYDYQCDGDKDYIILLEDLADSDYSPVSSSSNLRERDLVLKALAHFHAVSFALRIKNPDLFINLANAVPEVYYTERNRHWYTPYLQSALDIVRASLVEFEHPSSNNLKTFDQLVGGDVYGHFIDSVTQLGDHPVLCHGDAWTPNFLSSKDNVGIVDFQLLRCTSLATDVSYCMFMFGDQCRDKIDFLKAMRVYYDSFVYYLDDMGIDSGKVFTWEDLMGELNKFGKYGVLASLTSLPLLNSERCDVLESFEDRFSGVDRIPLEILWKLTPMKTVEQKMKLVNHVRLAVELGLI